MINISKKICMGWESARPDELPATKVIAKGDTAAEKKRLAVFVSKNKNVSEYDNVPLPGFTLFNPYRSGSSDPVWRIIDPRGFMCSITTDNLMNILRVTGITEGLIQERCVWARDDTKSALSLVPVSATLYAEAVGNTDILENKVSMKTVNIGDTVLLQNKKIGVYCGVLSLYGTLRNDSYNGKDFRMQHSIRKQVIEVSPGKFFYKTDLRILKVLDTTKAAITRVESATRLNECISANPSTFFTSGESTTTYHGSYDRVRQVSSSHTTDTTISLEEIQKDHADKLFIQSGIELDTGMLVVEDSNMKQFLIGFPYTHPRVVTEFKPIEIDRITDTSVHVLRTHRETINDKTRCTLDDFNKFYVINKHVDTNSFI